jgi:type IV pilus assembly protein PilV
MARLSKAKLPVRHVDSMSGFTVMEVLIAVVIMAVGILGVVGLQISSLHMNRDALMSVEANQLISGLVDRIDANPVTTYGPVTLGSAPTNGPDCTQNNCTPAQMADYDLSQWLCAINSKDSGGSSYPACVNLGVTGTFPQGKGSVSLTADIYRLYLQWTDIHTQEVRSTELFLQVD